MIGIEFDLAGFASDERSAALIEAFLDTHTPTDTEYACIHPYERLQRMRDTVYKPPVTVTPMFAGVYWANFLGAGHIDQFDHDKLSRLDGYKVKWVDSRGLFLIVSSRITDAESAETEAKMQQLTDLFRGALR